MSLDNDSQVVQRTDGNGSSVSRLLCIYTATKGPSLWLVSGHRGFVASGSDDQQIKIWDVQRVHSAQFYRRSWSYRCASLHAQESRCLASRISMGNFSFGVSEQAPLFAINWGITRCPYVRSPYR